MGAKCNITSLILQKIAALQWGVKEDEHTNRSILENYIQFTNCGIAQTICNPDKPCNTDATVFNCEFNITKLKFTTISFNTVAFSVESVDMYGGVSPYIYSWQFDSRDFDVSGPITTSSIILTVKAGKQLASLVSRVIVSVTDSKGCTDSKTCYLVNSAMICSVNYAPCLTPKSLQVLNKFSTCAKPKNLNVINKL